VTQKTPRKKRGPKLPDGSTKPDSRIQCDVDAFRRDWMLGLSRPELAALHGYTNMNAVTCVARKLGLPPRTRAEATGTALPSSGAWVPNGRGVLVWDPNPTERAS
jgi:hypothetical protein